MAPSDRVVVVTGAGGIAAAAARRLAPGATLLLGSRSERSLARLAEELRSTGYDVHAQVLDVADAAAVDRFAASADSLGRVDVVVHTAGVSPVTATTEQIIAIDLIGASLVLDAFGEVISAGGAGAFISSMAGAMLTLASEDERQLMMTPTDLLLELPLLSSKRFTHPHQAYQLAKRANQLRVRAASQAWGARHGRVNTISPGLVMTAMGAMELAQPVEGGYLRKMTEISALRRAGTPDDVAAVVEFLVGPQARFVTGTDVLVDGGVFGALSAGRLAEVLP